MIEKEKKIIEILLSDEAFNGNKETFKCKFSASNKDIKLVPHCLPSISFEKKKNWVRIDSIDNELLISDIIIEILMHFASKGKIYSDVEFEINPDGSYTSRYWFDEERLYKQDYDLAILRANDFPHAAATNLVNYHFFEIKFKRKFTRIHWTMEVKNGESFFDIYSINKKNQKLPVELQEIGVMFNVEDQMVYFEKFWKYSLLKHYETTNNGILKDVWKPWNKIVISIPPNGYLDENEDIAYYLDDVELEKDFFLRGY